MQILEFQGASILRWSPSGSHLCAGSLTGSLLFYDVSTQKKNVIVGKHSKKITSLAW